VSTLSQFQNQNFSSSMEARSGVEVGFYLLDIDNHFVAYGARGTFTFCHHCNWKEGRGAAPDRRHGSTRRTPRAQNMCLLAHNTAESKPREMN